MTDGAPAYRGAGISIELPFPSAKLSGHAKGKWWNTSGVVPTDVLYADYLETRSVWKTAERFGLNGSGVWQRFKRAGLAILGARFSAEENELIRREYKQRVIEGTLDDLASEMGRKKSSIRGRAAAMGLTDQLEASRAAARAAKAKCTGVPKWSDKPHPRGMAGKRHSAAVKDSLAQSSRAWWASLSPKEKDDQVVSNLKAAIAKNGRIGPITNQRATTWKAGWRDIGDKRHYFRSRWEANYARYLEWLKVRGDILEWEYEPETFWFDKIKRGVRSYLPDFRVHELNGAKILHEVKGWMDARSKTTLKRMAKYHPEVKIILIREKDYKALSRFSALIEGWE